jgi:hypothetical protein
MDEVSSTVSVSANDSFCQNVATIPQTRNTCWFNALLMALFYSQYSRELLLNTKTFKLKSNELDTILNFMLSSFYKRDGDKTKLFYDLYEPSNILKLLYRFKYTDREKKNRRIISKDEYEKTITNDDGNDAINILPRLIDYMKKKSLILDYYENNFYLHQRIYSKKILNIETKKFEFTNINIGKIYDKSIEAKDFINETYIPDYILINIIDPENNPEYNKKLHGTRDFDDKYTDKTNIATNETCITYTEHPFQPNSINEQLQDEIIFKGKRYKLDSCIIKSYKNDPKTNTGHAISGITCKENKYLYNGWLIIKDEPTPPQAPKRRPPPSYDKALLCDVPSSYEDAVKCAPPPLPSNEEVIEAMVKKMKTQPNFIKSPCNLMKFDWNSNEKTNFCLNETSCNIDDVKTEEMCLSFNKNDRTYIYVCVDYDTTATHNSHDNNDDLIITSTDEKIEKLTSELKGHEELIIADLNQMKENINYMEELDDYISGKIKNEYDKKMLKYKRNEAEEQLKQLKKSVDLKLTVINSLDSIITEYKIIQAINKEDFAKINSLKRLNFSYKLLNYNTIMDDNDYFEEKL